MVLGFVETILLLISSLSDDMAELIRLRFVALKLDSLVRGKIGKANLLHGYLLKSSVAKNFRYLVFIVSI
jgi:hypothetical protein